MTAISRDDKGRFVTAESEAGPIRAQALPHLLAGLACAAATLGWVLAAFADLLGLVIAATVATTAVAAVAVAIAAKARTWPRSRVLAASAAIALACGWSLVWVVAGPSLTAAAIGATLWLPVSWPWWAPRRLANPDPNALPVTEVLEGEIIEPEPELGSAEQLVVKWTERLAKSGGVLAGTILSWEFETEHTIVFRLQLVPGAQTLTEAVNALPKIATGLNTLAPKLIVEDHPDFEDASLGRLTVVTGRPIGTTVPYTGPTFDRAIEQIRLGPHTDGAGTANWRVFEPNTFHGGFVVGQKGSGKSRIIDIICHSLIADGRTVVWYGDPEDGASSTAMAANADWCARGMEAIKTMLRTAQRVMKFRKAENSVEGWDGFTPSPQRPALMIVIDEFSTACKDKEIREALLDLARRGRKVGVQPLGGDQQLDLGTFGDEALRNNIVSSNLIMLKTTSSNTKDLVGGVADGIDPTLLPDVPGYGYRSAPVGGDGRSIGRSAPFRAYHLGDDPGASTDWFDQIPLSQRARLDMGSATQAGPAYAGRHQSDTERLDQMRALVASARAGIAPVEHDDKDTNASTAGNDGEHYGQVIAFPTWAQFDPAVEAEANLTDTARKVLALIRDGADQPVKLQEATGLSERQVHNILKTLTTVPALIRKVGHGRYEAVPVHHDQEGPHA
ncbi:hypothetical protein [Glycomyces buryatensis]|uniref:FtsK domain-containing protein n=1 Tax=Glycomyces buryatensis TaxID=2570927 RepID=A0A4S8QGR1_9ACTN|nr:hypothetical protein [Glycomyces buryatensis]THV40569.1 hypothetical protein FAB82_14985 [Glycomyces buryatensis]